MAMLGHGVVVRLVRVRVWTLRVGMLLECVGVFGDISLDFRDLVRFNQANFDGGFLPGIDLGDVSTDTNHTDRQQSHDGFPQPVHQLEPGDQALGPGRIRNHGFFLVIFGCFVHQKVQFAPML